MQSRRQHDSQEGKFGDHEDWLRRQNSEATQNQVLDIADFVAQQIQFVGQALNLGPRRGG